MNYKIEKIDKLLDILHREYIFNYPHQINLLEKTKIIKKNILLTLDTAYKLAIVADEENIFDVSLSKKYIKEEIEKIRKDVVSIAVFGQMSCGKSSFLNSLVGDKLLTVAEERATATITMIRHIDNFDGKKDGDVEIHYKTANELLYEFLQAIDILNENFSKEVIRIEVNSIDDILNYKSTLLENLEYITHKDVVRDKRAYIKAYIHKVKTIIKDLEKHRNNIGKLINKNLKVDSSYLTDTNLSVFIDKIIFYKDLELLKNIEFVDTPGLGSNSQLDTIKSEEFIEKADIVMIITDAKEPMQKESEIDTLYMLEDIQKDKDDNLFEKVFIIVNKIDDTEKSREQIKEILLDSLNSEDIEILDKNILFVSSLYEFNKKLNQNNEIIIRNSNNIGKNDILEIEKTIYNFSAIEATSKFLSENIQKINKIFENTKNIFENNIKSLNQDLGEIQQQIQDFQNSKIEIINILKNEFQDILDDNFRTYEALSKSYIDDIRFDIANENYFTQRAKKSNKFKNANNDSTSSSYYKNIAKKLMNEFIEEANEQLEKNIKEKVLNKKNLEELKKKLNQKIEAIQKKYEKEYQVVLTINHLHFEPIKLNLTRNVDLDISLWKSIKQFFNLFLWGKENKYIDISAEAWEKYIRTNYFPSLEKEIRDKISMVKKQIETDMNKAIEDIIDSIDTQLQQKLKDFEQYNKNKELTIKKKNKVLDSFNKLQKEYIDYAYKQTKSLLG